jgi:endonuclease/exonuclease/phosphatase family metal-dependent hydrolase
MKLSILTWNVNFMHDNWLNRVKNINKTLEQHIDNTDIIALQEATLPFSNKISDIYKFLKCKTINYSTGAEFFFERNFLYKKINTLFPRYNKVITSILE